MNDKKRLNAEGAHKITQGEKDAWQRGKNDAAKNQKLSDINGINVDKAVQVVRMFAETGSEQLIRQRLGMSISDIRKALAGFGVKSIEDARAAVKKGVIADLDAAKQSDQETAASEAKVSHEKKVTNLNEHNTKFGAPKPKTDEEKDATLQARREEAFRKNKADKVRGMIAEGIKPVDPNAFQIRLSDVPAFKAMIHYGVSHLQRRFGGSAKDIVNEIKRLAPTVDVGMLRP